MDAGTAALVGAVIGSLGTGITTGFTAWNARRQTKTQLESQATQLRMQLSAQHVQAQRDPRSQSYVNFVSEVRSTLNAIRHLPVDLLMESVDVSDGVAIKEVGNRHRRKFHDLQPLYAAVAVQGPALVAHVGNEVMGQVNEAIAGCLEYLAECNTGGENPESSFFAVCDAADASVLKFLHVVRVALNDNGMMGSLDAAYYRAASERETGSVNSGD
ncbi:hypothetical protein [Streptomyces xanthophaeus]|uniref:hypothetical protein n=1 Tax=Streptomyces xanthophaeus TaxID=67385 RepID=UPI0037173EAB